MDIRQLERIRKLIETIRNEIVSYPTGSNTITTALDDLEEDVIAEMKANIWNQYLKERDQ